MAAASLAYGGCDSAGTTGGRQAIGGAGGQNGTSTSVTGACAQGDTRTCVGPGACPGAQECKTDLTWSTCDCGSTGSGGAGAGGASNSVATGGSQANVGGANPTGGAGPTGGANPTGGAGPTGGANPTGGASPTGGSSSHTGGAGTGGGTSNSAYITETDGRAVDAAHSIGGPLYTFTDPGASTISPDCSTGATCFDATGPTNKFCVTGKAAKAVTSAGVDCHLAADTCDWSSYWGAALAINLSQPEGSTDPVAWDGSAYKGITFTMAINSSPDNLRVYVNLMDGTSYCADTANSKTYTFTWAQLLTNCWPSSTDPQTPLSGTVLTQIQSISWQAGTNASQAMNYDFCVSNVKIN